MSARPAAADFNAFFRGGAFGAYDIFTNRSYADFVHRNDINLGQAIVVHEGSAMLGALAFGVRGTRAWFGLIGVDPQYRRAGIAARMMVDAIAAVQAQGVRAIELEVNQRNAAPIALCERFGFARRGELLVWARDPSGPAAPLPARRYPEPAVRAVAQIPSACWQREPRSIARAGPLALLTLPGAYAYVRTDDDGLAHVLDAGALDAVRARALVEALNDRVPHDVTLNNEPADSPLGDALRDGGWRIVERQYHMVRTV